VRSVVRSTLIFGAIFGPGFLILDAVGASDWYVFALALISPLVAGAIDRRIERRASE
jgi:hypothetical protein